MALFRRVNDQGRTVVLITHEDEVAACAQRVVRLRDGRVISDERTAPVGAHAAGRPLCRCRQCPPSCERWVVTADSVRIALRGIGANKLRSSLTVLGILIGVGAVIVLVAVGTGRRRPSSTASTRWAPTP